MAMVSKVTKSLEVFFVVVALAAISTRLVHGDLDPRSSELSLAPIQDSDTFVHPAWNPYNRRECLKVLLGVRNKCKLDISHSFRLPTVDPKCCKALNNVKNKCRPGAFIRGRFAQLEFLRKTCSKDT
ncbi:hypothetical protein Ancab_032943 [Ancistrocladus abbreviatus]